MLKALKDSFEDMLHSMKLLLIILLSFVLLCLAAGLINFLAN